MLSANQMDTQMVRKTKVILEAILFFHTSTVRIVLLLKDVAHTNELPLHIPMTYSIQKTKFNV